MKLKHLLPLFLIVTSTQCTVEKRLYTKGFHIERKHSLSSSSNKITEQAVSQEIIPENSIESTQISDLSSESLLISVDKTENSNFVKDSLPKDTVYISKSTKQANWTTEKKKKTLLRLGVGTFLTGLVAGSLLSQATAAGAASFTIAVSGFFGWIFTLIAAFLLLIFIICLCIPPKDRLEKHPNKTLSNGESLGLSVTLAAFGIIGVIILLVNLF